MFHFDEVSAVVKIRDKKYNSVFQEMGRGVDGELSNGIKLQLCKRKQFLEIMVRTVAQKSKCT